MITRHMSTPIMHRAVEHGGTVYLAGVIGDDMKASMKVQTAQALAKIEKVLTETGSSKSKLLAATLYITDMSLKGEMNEAWNEWLAPADKPARATIGVADLGEGVLIEIVVTAAK
ncbi:MAG TPA: RidA family protein [Thalassobaculum sp.]